MIKLIGGSKNTIFPMYVRIVLYKRLFCYPTHSLAIITPDRPLQGKSGNLATNHRRI